MVFKYWLLASVASSLGAGALAVINNQSANSKDEAPDRWKVDKNKLQEYVNNILKIKEDMDNHSPSGITYEAHKKQQDDLFDEFSQLETSFKPDYKPSYTGSGAKKPEDEEKYPTRDSDAGKSLIESLFFDLTGDRLPNGKLKDQNVANASTLDAVRQGKCIVPSETPVSSETSRTSSPVVPAVTSEAVPSTKEKSETEKKFEEWKKKESIIDKLVKTETWAKMKTEGVGGQTGSSNVYTKEKLRNLALKMDAGEFSRRVQKRFPELVTQARNELTTSFRTIRGIYSCELMNFMEPKKEESSEKLVVVKSQ